MAKLINPWKSAVAAWVPNWLMERHEISPGAKLCYARLAQYAGRNGYAWPLVATLARSLAVSPRQASNYIAELREHHLIQVTQSKDARSPNRYGFLEHEWMLDPEPTDEPKDRSPPAQARSVFHPWDEECFVPGTKESAHRRESPEENQRRESLHAGQRASRAVVESTETETETEHAGGTSSAEATEEN